MDAPGARDHRQGTRSRAGRRGGRSSAWTAGPSRVRMDVMVGTDARQARMLGAAATRAAGDDTADRAELHAWMVYGVDDEVYSPAVLRLRDQAVVGSRAERLRGRASVGHASRRGQALSPRPRKDPVSAHVLGPKRGPSRCIERALRRANRRAGGPSSQPSRAMGRRPRSPKQCLERQPVTSTSHRQTGQRWQMG